MILGQLRIGERQMTSAALRKDQLVDTAATAAAADDDDDDNDQGRGPFGCLPCFQL